MKSLTEYIRAYALKNSLEYGNAVLPKVLPKLFNHGLKKEDIKKFIPEISKTIKEVNSLTKERREEEFSKLKRLLPEKRERSHELPELDNIKNLVMRFEPSPSGPLHIGHAYVLSLNNEYVKKHNGKLILRIGDTNPENIYEPGYKLIEEDAKWLTKNNISKVMIQSERLHIYYKYLEKLLDLDKVYICTCETDAYKKLINSSKACPCRTNSNDEQRERWKKMFKGYKSGEAVARLKTNLGDKNPAMRDFPLFRINDHSHPLSKNKFRVWPLMNMAVAVDDAESKVTAVIRAKDHVDNSKRQEIIHSYLKKKTPQALFVGKINFLGLPLSSTKVSEEIKNKKYNGWDDIRLPFLPALRKRGFQPEAISKYAMGVGVSLTDKTVSKEEFFKAINHFNKEVIDKTSNRYFFVQNPKKIKIKCAHPKQFVEIPLHPDEPTRGYRKLKVEDEFYVQDKLEYGKDYRLMHLLNFRDKEFTSHDVDPKIHARMIHWLPVSDELVKVKVLMDDGKDVKGLGESDLKKVKVGEIVQFERFGFVRLDKKEKGDLVFWFLHK